MWLRQRIFSGNCRHEPCPERACEAQASQPSASLAHYRDFSHHVATFATAGVSRMYLPAAGHSDLWHPGTGEVTPRVGLLAKNCGLSPQLILKPKRKTSEWSEQESKDACEGSYSSGHQGRASWTRATGPDFITSPVALVQLAIPQEEGEEALWLYARVLKTITLNVSIKNYFLHILCPKMMFLQYFTFNRAKTTKPSLSCIIGCSRLVSAPPSWSHMVASPL